VADEECVTTNKAVAEQGIGIDEMDQLSLEIDAAYHVGTRGICVYILQLAGCMDEALGIEVHVFASTGFVCLCVREGLFCFTLDIPIQ
jgi:hypothetical protein